MKWLTVAVLSLSSLTLHPTKTAWTAFFLMDEEAVLSTVNQYKKPVIIPDKTATNLLSSTPMYMGEAAPLLPQATPALKKPLGEADPYCGMLLRKALREFGVKYFGR